MKHDLAHNVLLWHGRWVISYPFQPSCSCMVTVGVRRVWCKSPIQSGLQSLARHSQRARTPLQLLIRLLPAPPGVSDNQGYAFEPSVDSCSPLHCRVQWHYRSPWRTPAHNLYIKSAAPHATPEQQRYSGCLRPFVVDRSFPAIRVGVAYCPASGPVSVLQKYSLRS